MTLTVWDESGLPCNHAEPGAVVRLPSLEEVVLQWSRVASMLHRATVRTQCYEPIDILQLAMTGQLCIWFCELGGTIEAVLVTEVKIYPRRRVLEVLFGGGNGMRHWIERAVATFDEYARQLGCSHVATAGRPGWARAWGGRLTGDVIIARDLA